MTRPVSLFLSLSLLYALSISVTCATFKCSSRDTCQSLLGYTPRNATTISTIQHLFGVESLHSLLGANSFPLSTEPSQIINANSTVRVPIPCKCGNGSGISDDTPFYTVKKDDGLDAIARTIFSGFVTFQEIAAINNIKNPDIIITGAKLRIPLPCSCDDVDTARVVHYGHVVAAGSSVEQIAKEFGTAQETLLALNNLSDPKDLQAGQILDVPLKACSSSINSTAEDISLLLPNHSYALTANNCVKCSCHSSNWQLKCKPSQVVRIVKWSKCPSMQCGGPSNLYIGNTSVSATCSNTTCAYAGYTEDEILTTLITQPTCPTAGAPGSQPPGNSAGGSQTPGNSADGRLGLQGSRWMWIFISLNVGLLSFGLPW
ncbi:lysM domain-containing GPI-anchored protein 2 isoform X2 [Magnolia sinica]|uniref:lysM domain-containing GPI-anchored protein 2 isoform X2 n=1 Tax=Magnolia sinica TaxID=86752 RepID=UPI002658CBC8|nr:lysM domain-containing GPI-anchored protein 2 isoform X2 [Magnolia sinica]